MDQRLYIAEENCKRLDVFLSEQTDEFTRSRLKKLVEDGNVTINGKPQTKAGADMINGVRINGVRCGRQYEFKPDLNIGVPPISGISASASCASFSSASKNPTILPL